MSAKLWARKVGITLPGLCFFGSLLLASSVDAASSVQNGKSGSKPKTARVAKTATVQSTRTTKTTSLRPQEPWQLTRDLVLASSAALVVEQGVSHPMYVKNAEAVVPIASITKLMSAMVLLDGSPDLQALVTVGDEDVDYLRGSRSRLHVGAVLSRHDALLLSLMASENRTTHALARHYPGGVSAFVAAMNAKALQLGMRHTRFEDPTGLSSANVSTAQDLVRMVTAAYRYPLIREFSTTGEARVEVDGRLMAYRNTNQLVKSSSWDIGLSKTGFINEAGKCLVMQARVADKPVVIVLLDSAGKQTRIGDANRIRRWLELTHAGGSKKTRSA